MRYLFLCALLAAGCDERATGADGSVEGDAGCAPVTCAERGADCGNVADGCGGELSCGACEAGESCGGGGPNRCGTGECTAVTCAELAADCGQISDGYADVLRCGECAEGETCGAGGPNRCGTGSCTARTCEGAGAICGPLDDGCGRTLRCGDCEDGQTCGLDAPNRCGGECTEDRHCEEGELCESAECVLACSGPSASVAIDVPFVDVTSAITLGGGALSAFTSAEWNGEGPYIRLVNELGSFSFTIYTAEYVGPGYRYTPRTGSVRITPGTYDVRYYPQNTDTPSFDEWPITQAVIHDDRSIAGDGALAIDVPFADVTPAVTRGSAALSAFTSTEWNGDGPYVRLVNELGSYSFGVYTSEYVGPGYRYTPRTSTIRVTPGTYDVHYYPQNTDTPSFDEWPITQAVLEEDRAIDDGALAIDVRFVDVTPELTRGSAALSAFTSTEWNGEGPYVRLVNQLGSHGFTVYTSEYVGPGYRYTPRTGAVRITPGAYDIHYYPQNTDTPSFDEWPITQAVLDDDRAIASGALEIDVPFADITPTVTRGGAALAAFTSTEWNGEGPYVRLVNELGSYGFTIYTSEYVGPGYRYTRRTGSVRVTPGTYDVLYYPQNTDTPSFDEWPITQAVIHDGRVLASGALAIDVPFADLMPEVTRGGEELAAFTSADWNGEGPYVQLVNELGSFVFAIYSSEYVGPGYRYTPRTSAVRVTPGAYDIRYYPQNTDTPSFDEWPITQAILDPDRTIAAGALAIDVPFADVEVSVTLGGAALRAFTSAEWNGESPYLRLVNELGSHTFTVYTAEYVGPGYRYSPREARVRVTPGRYDVLYYPQNTDTPSFDEWPITQAELLCHVFAE
jgi:hypothetical protein